MYQPQLDFAKITSKVGEQVYGFVHPIELQIQHLTRKVDKLDKDVAIGLAAKYQDLDRTMREALGHGEGEAAAGTIKRQALDLVRYEIDRIEIELKASVKDNTISCHTNKLHLEDLSARLDQWHDVQDINGRDLERYQAAQQEHYGNMNKMMKEYDAKYLKMQNEMQEKVAKAKQEMENVINNTNSKMEILKDYRAEINACYEKI